MILKYDVLKNITNDSEIFYSRVEELGNYTVEHFTYRLASFSDFNSEEKLEMRGVCFLTHINKVEINPVLLCRPFKKFFNLREGEVNYSNDVAESITNKEDGSMVVFCKFPNNDIRAKTKTSFSSEQAPEAQKLLDNNLNLKNMVSHLLNLGYTPIFEYVSPTNQIVLKYDEPQLKLLSIRNMDTGDYLSYNEMLKFVSQFELNVNEILVENRIDLGVNFVKEGSLLIDQVEQFINAQTNTEGIVVNLKSGRKFKIKSIWYVDRHHIKDQLGNDKYLIKATVNEELDDIIGLFGQELFDMEHVREIQTQTGNEYNYILKTCEMFYETNKELNRKDYAILATKGFELKPFFGYVMGLYLNNQMSFKDAYFKFKGIKLDPKEDEIEG